MRFLFRRIVLLFIFSIAAYYCKSQNAFFTDAPENSFINAVQKRVIIPEKYRTVKLNPAGILSFFESLPSEQNITNPRTTPVLVVPMPNGTMAKFHVWESAAMAPILAAAHPNIRTFTGQGIDDPTATIKFDWTKFGFHAMILSPLTGSVFIDPFDQQTVTNYISYYKADYKKKDNFFELGPIEYPQNENRPAADNVLAGFCVGSQLRTYKLAIACTNQYAIAATGLANPTTADALAKIVITVNRVNGVYEKELSIRLVLVNAETSVIFTSTATDPFTGNNNASTLINESQTIIDNNIGTANYDIGHTFSTGGGGLAGLRVVCINGQKARGITGSANPVNDAYDIDYVAHEMGHQFGGNHTFNSASGNCSGNGSSSSNAEPGSGSTIMAYAGICGNTDNLQANSNPQFHAISFNQISTYSTTGNGNSCPVISPTGNTQPSVAAGLDYVIPKSTPFFLTGSATDPNGDALTFSWEQIDVGGTFAAWNNPSGNAPLFRSNVPQASPVRFFPKLDDVIGNISTRGELLPTYARTLNFRLTARDNRAGGGGVCFDESTVTISGTAGPFQVTSPNSTGIDWLANEFRTVTWDPSGTGAAPVSCSNVKIELSTDGGLSFPITVLAATPNDGQEEILVPNNVTSLARIRITAVGNVFYDMSNANFTIQNSPEVEFVFSNPLPVTTCGGNISVATLNTASRNGFTTNINLSATGVPPGTTITFGSGTLSPGSNTTVTLNNISSLASGTYNVTINGVAGIISKARVISFVVSGPPAPPSTLTIPAINATGVAILPSFNWTAVAGAGSYKLEISFSGSFSQIAQTISNITALPAILTAPLTENTTYYWRITTTNSCGTSAVSATGIFRTGITVCNSRTQTSTDIPKAISATGTPTVTSTLTIPAASGITISDLNVVGLTGTHSYVGDITVKLTSPAGTTVTLFDQVCDNAANFNINLDDEAAGNIACPPTGNQTAKSLNPLSAFDGQNSAGTWTLTIKDNFDVDGGSLAGWGLVTKNCTFISTPVSSAPWSQLCPPFAGTLLTSNLTGASYQWQLNTGSGFVNITNNANYSGATTATLQVINAPSSWNGYQYRCVVDGNNSNDFILGFASYWNGSVSNAWENAANWNCNAVPDANTDVYIFSGTAVVNSNATGRSVSVNPGSSVTVNSGFKLTVAH
ncbi:MAG: proprotein convertase P-domain-containing protein [Ferruginibacter sp.]|nr:proprotein convertase P-domain-containing protein [Ferruginibacter sp.]